MPFSTLANYLPPLPAASVIQVHDASDVRLVLAIAPGSGATGLGFFALIWNGFMAVFTAAWIAAFWQQKAPDAGLFVFLFIGLFWLIGLGFLYAWLKMKFERCLLLIERDRIVLRRLFLGRQRQVETLLDNSSRAQLTEAYKQNETPVYRVTITGANQRAIHLGTSLTPAEKDWSVDAINAFLHGHLPESTASSERSVPSACEVCGAEFARDVPPPSVGYITCPACQHQQSTRHLEDVGLESIADSSIPAEGPEVVTILEDSPERLGFQLPFVENHRIRWSILIIVVIFSVVWYSVSLGSVFRHLFGNAAPMPRGVGSLIEFVFFVPFVISGLVPIAISVLAFRGRMTTWIDHETASVRVHVGPFGKSWTMRTADITAVRLVDSSEMPSRRNPRIANSNPRVSDAALTHAAALCAGPRILAMSALHSDRTSGGIVQMVREWLRQNVRDK